MELFSQRKGIKPPKSKIQSDSMDDDLRIGLWNILTISYWSRLPRSVLGTSLSYHSNLNILIKRLWVHYFKIDLDKLDDNWKYTHNVIKAYFFSFKWYEVYDFIEFVANNYPDNLVNKKYIEFCNNVLEKELSAYRFIGGIITQITSKEEISAIEEAIKVPIDSVREHLNRSLELLSDRKNPDYRNSIKEAVSAVESLCRLIIGKKASLGQALKEIERKGALYMHSAFNDALIKLYGYVSNDCGIRHSLMKESHLSLEDARFMLVICSSFVNYLRAKAEKAGIDEKVNYD